MMNPYMKRRQGREPVRYAHPSLEPILKRTLGVPLFQEQLLRIAMTACQLYRAARLRTYAGPWVTSDREKRMLEIENKLRRGMEQNGIGLEAQQEIITSISSFALYGFPESHAGSFCLDCLCECLLEMSLPGSIHGSFAEQSARWDSIRPPTIVKDAQRHGLRSKPVDVPALGVAMHAGAGQFS
jgi:error-prone DNA polymerase